MTSPADAPLETCALEPVWFLWIELSDRDGAVRDAVIEAAGLVYGDFDSVCHEQPAGTQFFRPLPGSAAEHHEGTVEMPVRVLSFSLPRDPALLGRAIEAARAVHSYEEPVIYVTEAFATRADPSADRDNPNRWWNRGYAV